MPKVENYKQGTPSWTDLSTTDPDAAKEFYSEIFGWEYQDIPMGDDQVYSMAQIEGSAVSAIFTQQAEETENNVPPHWNVYITVDDIEAIIAKVGQLGGTVIATPSDELDAGRMIVAQDPAGAFIQFWQSDQHIGAELRDEHGAMTWVELLTTDQEGAGKFFSDLLGVAVDKDTMPTPEGSPYHMLMADGMPVAGIMDMPQNLIETGVPPHWEAYFRVDDAQAVVETAKSKGAQMMFGPEELPMVGTVAVLMDPQGAVFGIQQPPAE
jgi:predicted enzyme related to lactoylglutathione lyase